jgi:hypothetical protein
LLIPEESFRQSSASFRWATAIKDRQGRSEVRGIEVRTEQDVGRDAAGTRRSASWQMQSPSVTPYYIYYSIKYIIWSQLGALTVEPDSNQHPDSYGRRFLISPLVKLRGFMASVPAKKREDYLIKASGFSAGTLCELPALESTSSQGANNKPDSF